MTNAQIEREYFWKIYQKFLDESGNPFKLRVARDLDGAPRHYALLNQYSSDAWCIFVDFSIQKEVVRCGVCMNDDEFFDRFCLLRRAWVESELGARCSWTQGEKSANIRRVTYNIGIIPFDRESYIKAAKESIEKLKIFLRVFGPVLEMDASTRKQIARDLI